MFEGAIAFLISSKGEFEKIAWETLMYTNKISFDLTQNIQKTLY